MEDVILKELRALKDLTLLGTKKVLTMNECALLTGLSKSHIYKLTMKKEIPYFKSQGAKFIYFDKSELEAWMLRNRVKTNDEMEQEAATYCTKNRKYNGSAQS